MQSIAEILEDETLTTSERVEKAFIEAPAIAVEEMKEYIAASLAAGFTNMMSDGTRALMGHGTNNSCVSNGKMSADGTYTCTVTVPVPVTYITMTFDVDPAKTSEERAEEVLPEPDNMHYMPMNLETLEVTNPWSGETFALSEEMLRGQGGESARAAQLHADLYTQNIKREQKAFADKAWQWRNTILEKEQERMAEEEDAAWRAAIMANESLTMAERVERIMMGRPRPPRSAEKLVGAMNVFAKRLADEKKAAERFDEEERARVLKEQG